MTHDRYELEMNVFFGLYIMFVAAASGVGAAMISLVCVYAIKAYDTANYLQKMTDEDFDKAAEEFENSL